MLCGKRGGYRGTGEGCETLFALPFKMPMKKKHFNRYRYSGIVNNNYIM